MAREHGSCSSRQSWRYNQQGSHVCHEVVVDIPHIKQLHHAWGVLLIIERTGHAQHSGTVRDNPRIHLAIEELYRCVLEPFRVRPPLVHGETPIADPVGMKAATAGHHRGRGWDTVLRGELPECGYRCGKGREPFVLYINVQPDAL